MFSYSLSSSYSWLEDPFFKTCCTCAMISNIFVVASYLLLSSSLTDSLLLVNSPRHWNVARNTAGSLYAFLCFCCINQVSHKTELQHIAIFMQKVAVLRRVNLLCSKLVCRVRRDHTTTSHSFEKIVPIVSISEALSQNLWDALCIMLRSHIWERGFLMWEQRVNVYKMEII